MTLAELQETFSIPGMLRFTTHGELVRAEVHTPAAQATLYLQGAHLTHWQPIGQAPVLFLSEQARFERGTAIRGGVPISFPWFATRSDGRTGPAHGFARIQPWELAFAAMAGDELHLTLTLGPGEESVSLGFDHFRVVYELRIGKTLRLRLTVANEAAEPLIFEEAFHTYFSVDDVRQTTVTGLEPTAFLDKTQGSEQSEAAGTALTFAAATDRVYLATEAACVLHDLPGKRAITNHKAGSRTTVVFNPWKAMADLGEAEWPHLLCLETANAGVDRVTLPRGETHSMEAEIVISPVAKGPERASQR